MTFVMCRGIESNGGENSDIRRQEKIFEISADFGNLNDTILLINKEVILITGLFID